MRREPLRREALKREYEQGATLRELGEKYGRSFQAIHFQLKKAGTAFRPRMAPLPPRICPACEKPFPPGHHRQIHCSLSCAHPAGGIRKAVCRNGHAQTPENRIPGYRSKGGTRCKACQKATQKRYRQSKKGKRT